MAARQPLLVTGATGFIGSNLVKSLVAAGEEVHIIVRKSSNLSALGHEIEKLHLHYHNGSTGSMISILNQSRPVCVFHLATLFLSDHTAADVTPLIKSNILFGAQLLEAMDASHTGVLVNAGTTWQHFGDEKYAPVNLYSATKQAFEDLLTYYTSARSFNAITLELTDTYGPGDPRQKIFSLLSRSLANGTSLLMSPGEQCMDLVYIDDVVQAFLRAKELLLKKKLPGNEKYQVTAIVKPTLREVVEIFESACQQKLELVWGGRPYPERQVMNPWNQGKILPGWTPKINLEEGIRRMLAQKQVSD